MRGFRRAAQVVSSRSSISGARSSQFHGNGGPQLQPPLRLLLPVSCQRWSTTCSTSDGNSNNLSNVWFKVTDLEIASGKGSWVTTTSGARYLDFATGIAVNSTGHSHPQVVDAITNQTARGIHLQANVFARHDLMQPLASKLNEITPSSIDTFFFANSGAEITEAAVKLAKQATGRPHMIVFQGSFHGRTHQAMAMTTSSSGYRAGHAPLPAGVFTAPFPRVFDNDSNKYTDDDVDAETDRCLAEFDLLLATTTSPSETAAVILEPVLGEGGYKPAPKRFLRSIMRRCQEHGMLFIADEVQSGFGRTGRMFAMEHYMHGDDHHATDDDNDDYLEPDIICMAKGIASGFPFSALGTRRELDNLWPTGSHGGTYGANPIGCAAALATIDILTADGFLNEVNARGDQLRMGLLQLQQEYQTAEGILTIQDVRGLGLMLAIDLKDRAVTRQILQHCLHESNVILMTAGVSGNTIRFMPPLTVSEEEVDLVLKALAKAIAEIHQ